jgi:hypothetical protein
MGANNYAYHLPDQDPWATRSDNPNDKFIDSLDGASALRLAQRAIATENERAAADQFQMDEKTFRKMYPAYADSEHNMKAMKHHWESVLGVTIPTLEQIEDSFFSLRASGVPELNAKAVARENEEAILRRAAEIREKREAMAFDEADADSMPFEELERRARQGW